MEQFIRVAVVVACLWASPPQLMAQNPDIEAMKRSLEAQIGLYQRMNELEQRVTKLERQKGGDPSVVVAKPPAAGSGEKASNSATPEPAKTAICRCMGSNRGVCFCLQNGVACKCHSSKGSVWNLNEQGRAVSKTGEYADPRGNATVARSNAPSRSAPADDVPRQRSDGKWWWKANGSWFGTASLTEGQTYVSGTNRFVYRGGRMVSEAAPMAVVIQPQSGHWERRCVGGVCRMYWIAD